MTALSAAERSFLETGTAHLDAYTIRLRSMVVTVQERAMYVSLHVSQEDV